MSERSSITEITIGKTIGATSGVTTRGLYIYGNNWTSATCGTISATFKTLAVRSREGKEKLLYVEGEGDIGSGASQSWSVKANDGTGLAKLDTGSFTADKWYYLYILYSAEDNEVSSCYSLSGDYPAFVGNYTYYRRVAALRSSGTSFLNIRQFDDKLSYYDPVTVLIPADAGAEASWTAIGISNFIPPTARIGTFIFGNNSRGGGLARELDGHGGIYMQMNNSIVGDNFNNANLCPANRYTWSTMNLPIFGAITMSYYYIGGAGKPYIVATGWEDNLNIYY